MRRKGFVKVAICELAHYDGGNGNKQFDKTNECIQIHEVVKVAIFVDANDFCFGRVGLMVHHRGLA